MKLVWAQIKNFRSIKDSGKIYFNPNLTVLAGKNESGKSNILKALDCFSKNTFDRDSDYPIDYISEYPEVIVHFELEDNDLQNIKEFFTLNKNSSKKSNGVTITRTAESNEVINIEIFNDTLEYIVTETDKATAAINKELRTRYKTNIEAMTSASLVVIIREINSLLTAINNLDNEQINKISTILQDLDSYFDLLTKIHNFSVGAIFKETIPNFVYFSSFEDIIPDSISSNAEITPIVNRFFKVVNQDPSLLFGETSPQRRRLLTDRISKKVSGNFMGYYSQDSISLTINLDGNGINFFVYGLDNQKPFQPRQRSQGLQWFLSFYLTLEAEMKTGSILLIDEPGLYLHASAQEDLSIMLNDLSVNSPIVISTHSHWLMDPNRLERIRLVIKDNDSTYVENKIHKGADNNTMKPILSAIGLGLKNNISTFGKRVVLVEGYSDYYYLEAMRYYFNEILEIKLDNFKLYPCLGSAQIINVLTLIIDSETDYYILLDNDKAGQQTEKKLKNECGIDKSKILFTPAKSKIFSAIEGVFSEKDFKEIVLNSLETTKFDKVLVSKKFNERMHNKEITKLSDETVSNFKEILDVIGIPQVEQIESLSK
ncbi:AAA family ATPase [Paenibacillus sp. FSL H7-0940]|uniref:ATP-dependent nuclease n=1 Tax=Paenibacillus sp. FSL H7-0940 TaxID=2921443 RepID=UPI0030ED55AE